MKEGSEPGSHVIGFRKASGGDPEPVITGPAETPWEEWDMVRGPGRGHGCARGDEASLLLGGKNPQREDAPEKTPE